METTITLADIRSQNVRIHPHEAVAVAQSLMRDLGDLGEARSPYGPLSLDTVAVDTKGKLHCRGTAATPSVPEVAILLQALLADGEARVPNALRYTLSRALHEVEAPPFDSIDEFAAALERFERGAPSDVLARLFDRTSQAAPAAAREAEPHGAGPQPEERRQGGPSAAQLRRELRTADLRLYEAQQSGVRSTEPPRSNRQSRRAPLAACMVAGVALVAVGEVSHINNGTNAGNLPRPVRTAPVASEPVSPYLSQPAAPVFAPSVSPRQDSAVSTTPATSSPKVDRPRTDRRSASVRRQASVRGVRATASSRRAHNAREKDDKGVIARIRFEWDNPFR
jgi:hypothetical protein